MGDERASGQASKPEPGQAMWGLLAEYESPGRLLQAAEKVRDAGYRHWDCYTPFPVHGLDRAMGMRDTRLPWVVLIGGFTGATIGLLLQWWTNAVDYQFVVSGKPLFSLPANIPVIFELTILLSALSAFGAMFFLNDLPKFYHPTFRRRSFKRVTTDRFFLSIEAADPSFDIERTEALLRSTGTQSVERLEG